MAYPRGHAASSQLAPCTPKYSRNHILHHPIAYCPVDPSPDSRLQCFQLEATAHRTNPGSTSLVTSSAPSNMQQLHVPVPSYNLSDHWAETCGHSFYLASCFCSRFPHSNSTMLPTVSSQACNCSFTSSPTLEAPTCTCMNDLLTRQGLRPSCPSMLPCTPHELHFYCL